MLYKFKVVNMEKKMANKGRANYTAISLPKDLMNDVEGFIRRFPRYRSQAEFTKIAIIEKMQKDVVFNESLRNDYIYPRSNKNFTMDTVSDFINSYRETEKSINDIEKIHKLVTENNTMISQIKKALVPLE